MSVTDYQLHVLQAPFHQALQELMPVELLFTEGDLNAQNQAFSPGIHSAGDQNRRIPDLTIHLHFLVHRIKVQVYNWTKKPIAPSFQDFKEQSSCSVDLSGSDFSAAQRSVMAATLRVVTP